MGVPVYLGSTCQDGWKSLLGGALAAQRFGRAVGEQLERSSELAATTRGTRERSRDKVHNVCFFALEGFNFFAVQLLWWQNAF